MCALLGVFGAGCAVNVSEARSARVLRGGEMQVAEINNVVVPTRAVQNGIRPAKRAAQAAGGRELSDEERDALVGAAAAIALTGPGFGVHTDFALGLGYRFDVQGRLGNGIYALSLRRGLDLGRTWHAAFGVRAAYNSGSAFIEYVDYVTDVVDVSSTRRFDGQLFYQMGAEFGEWGKLWFGMKGMLSPLRSKLDARRIGAGVEEFHTTLWHAGGFAGAAVGFRWIHVVGEITVLSAGGDVELFGRQYDLSGVVIAPSWGLMGTF